MFSKKVTDTSRVTKMTIVGDATTCNATSDDSRGVIYDRNIFIIQATGCQLGPVSFLIGSQPLVVSYLIFSFFYDKRLLVPKYSETLHLKCSAPFIFLIRFSDRISLLFPVYKLLFKIQ